MKKEARRTGTGELPFDFQRKIQRNEQQAEIGKRNKTASPAATAKLPKTTTDNEFFYYPFSGSEREIPCFFSIRGVINP